MIQISQLSRKHASPFFSLMIFWEQKYPYTFQLMPNMSLIDSLLSRPQLIFSPVSFFTKKKKTMEAVVAVLHKKEEKKSKVCLTSSYLLLANGKLLTSCFTIKLLIKKIYFFLFQIPLLLLKKTIQLYLVAYNLVEINSQPVLGSIEQNFLNSNWMES